MRFFFPAIFIASAVLVLLFVVKPLYEDVQALREKSRQFDDALVHLEELTDIRERLTTKYQSFAIEDIDRITKLLPNNLDNVALILEIDDIARSSGMRIRDISIGEDEEENPRGGTRNSREKTSKNTPYETVSLSFSTSGPYASFISFLQDLERSIRLVEIPSISIHSTDGALDYTLSLEAYWLK